MLKRYCATGIKDLDAFEAAILDMGAQRIFTPVKWPEPGTGPTEYTWQAWFQIDGDLHSETLLFLVLRADIAELISVETHIS